MNGTTIYNSGQTGEVNTLINNLNKKIHLAANATTYDEVLAQIKGEISSEEKPTSEMTLDEYKNYFSEKLNEIPFHESRKKDVELIRISDAAWERLKKDPAYEQKILSDITRDRAQYNSILGIVSPNSGECKVRYIEETSEKCRTISTEDGKIADFNAEISGFGDFWATKRNKKFMKNLINTQEKYLKQQIMNQVYARMGATEKISSGVGFSSSITSALLYANIF